ncbi:protein SPO16 homolog [Falco peregrinus]|uniref:protein SPO16 homolog n=1 Tax=Falco peregrinus TaxID=8954 RepID=UPI002479BDC2|nr:protein SPO16 homolog [Falco peregrinus]
MTDFLSSEVCALRLAGGSFCLPSLHSQTCEAKLVSAAARPPLFRRWHLRVHCRTTKPLKKMAESGGQEQPRWVTTVIMSTALQNHEISTVLQRQQHRVRYSESVEIGSVIFSLSGISSIGVAFILSDIQDLLMTGEEQFSKRIQNFINIHRNSFLVLSAALHGPEEWNVMFRIQRRFLGSNLRIIPAHNTAETVKLMLTIAKVTSKPRADDIRYKMAMTKAQIIENSPVWKMLQEYQLHCN